MRIKEGMRAIFINAPADVIEAMQLPHLEVSTRLSGMFDYIHIFAVSHAELERRFAGLKAHLAPDGKLWVSWPKNGQLGTDLKLTATVIPLGYDHGLVESTCLSINDTWSGLRFTHPKQGRVYKNSHAKLRLS